MHLLIVDDDPICSFLSTRVAETSGLFKQIRSAHNGKDALNLIQLEGNLPDLILLDLNMPLLNGFEFIQTVRDLAFPGDQTPAIIVVTSSVDDRDRLRVRELGIEHWLSKPLTAKDLHMALLSLPARKHKPGIHAPTIDP